MSENAFRDEMCQVGALLWSRELIGGGEGNLSIRLEDGSILCTPSGGSKGNLKPGDLVRIDPEGTPLEGKRPSSEIRLHLGIYRKRTECRAIVHAHPITATAFSVAGMPFPSDSIPEAAAVLGPVAIVPFAIPGTEEVPSGLEPYLDAGKTFLLSHHGAVALGKTLTEAAERMETLERVARIFLAARFLGGAIPISHPGYEGFLSRHFHGRLE